MGFNIHILSGRNRSTNLAGHAALAASFNHKSCDLWRPKIRAIPYVLWVQPALFGLHVSCGFRQSIPSNI